MTKVEKIEQDVGSLSASELEQFRDWFQRFDSENWDRQFEQDARAGKLDALAGEALADHRAGRSREL